MSEEFDVLVLGSGPSGVQAAEVLLEKGFKTAILDGGHDDTHYAPLIPDLPFSEVRKADPNQHRYFLGDRLEGIPPREFKTGAHLTPPRQFIVKDIDTELPFSSPNFRPLQTLALGGLGAGWGGGAFTFNEQELKSIGVDPRNFSKYYEDTAKSIGVSGRRDDRLGQEVLNIQSAQKPLDLDSNGKTILETYEKSADVLKQKGFRLGQLPLAILSENLLSDPTRSPNPYHDMDFYVDHQRSFYRPKYTLEKLKKNSNFTFLGGRLAVSFESTEQGVTVNYKELSSQKTGQVKAKKLVLCTGALNSARLCLKSFGLYDQPVPLLCNPFVYLPVMNLKQLGRPADDRRHSAGQLAGILETPAGAVTCVFYSFRSLLLFRLVKDMPLPPYFGLLLARTLMNCLNIVGTHFPETPSKEKWLKLMKTSSGQDDLQGNYEPTVEQKKIVKLSLRKLIPILWKLRCIPINLINPGYGASIHYAGTIPFSDKQSGTLSCDRQSRLHRAPNVYVADSSTWTALPSKGLTFTLMANARRVAEGVQL